MSAFIIAVFSALCSTQASGFSQNIKGLKLHAKFGGGLFYELPGQDLNLADEHVSQVAKEFVKTHKPKDPTVFKEKYGPIEEVDIPGLYLTRPFSLSSIRITGLHQLQLDDLQWRMKQNTVTWSATCSSLLVDVTFDNLHIELGKYFNDEELITTVSLSVHLLGLRIEGSARYNVKREYWMDVPVEPNFRIDKAEVDIYAEDVLYDINVQSGLEEVRYILAEIMNNPSEDIMDAILEVIVKEINKELLGKMDPVEITKYMINKIPADSELTMQSIFMGNST